MTKISRTKVVIASLIYFPFFALIVGNLIPPSSTIEVSSFPRHVIIGFIILSSIFLLFLAALKNMPEKFNPYFIAIFVFSYLIFLDLLIFYAVHTAHDLKGMFLNLYAIPSPFLIYHLLAINIAIIVLMFFMEINKRILILIFFGLIVFSLCFAAGKEMFYGYQLEKFFGNHKEGKIIFVSAFGDHNEFYAFYLLDRKIKKYPQGKFIQTQKRLSAELPGSFSPDKKFKVYEYAYDRDDLSKIFVANIKTRETILLAQGESPVWIR